MDRYSNFGDEEASLVINLLLFTALGLILIVVAGKLVCYLQVFLLGHQPQRTLRVALTNSVFT